MLTGRLVSPTGEPLPNVLIGGTYETDYNSLAQLSETRTDAEGRFRYEIPGGGPYRVGSQSIGLLPFARDLTVQAGEQLDFGELVVTEKGFSGTVTAKSRLKRTQSSAADATQKANSKSAESRMESKTTANDQSAQTPGDPKKVEQANENTRLRLAGACSIRTGNRSPGQM